MTQMAAMELRPINHSGDEAIKSDRKTREKAFRTARRHSIMVRVLRVLLPAGGLALAVTAAIPAVTPRFEIPGVQIESISFNGDALTMDKPRLTGFDNQDRGYEVNARQARQTVKNPKIIKLDEIDAKMEIDQSSFATLGANSGVLDTEKETLLLEKDVVVRSTTGYEAFLEAARIDLKAGLVTSEKPVEVKTGGGKVEAKGLEIRDKGNTIVFRKGVKMTVVPSGRSDTSAGTGMSAAKEAAK